jgi:hypothetical protein
VRNQNVGVDTEEEKGLDGEDYGLREDLNEYFEEDLHDYEADCAGD